MAHVFQTDFPTQECQIIATAVLTRNFSLSLIREAWVVAEFGLAQVVPQGVVSPHVVGATLEVGETEAFQQLLAACETEGKGLVGALPTLSWLTILKTILQLVINLIPATPTPVPTP